MQSYRATTPLSTVGPHSLSLDGQTLLRTCEARTSHTGTQQWAPACVYTAISLQREYFSVMFFLMLINRSSWPLILRDRFWSVIKGSSYIASSDKRIQSKLPYSRLISDVTWSRALIFFRSHCPSFSLYCIVRLWSSNQLQSTFIWHTMEFKIVNMLL
jgi:hypothetical protein